MKKWIVLFLILSIVYESWAVPKPMESITNYNVLLLHGAYGHYKKDKNGKVDKSKPQGFLESETIPSANDADDYLGNATIGRYTDNSRINYWLSKEIFEEPEWEKPTQGVHNSCIYHWRAFSSPPNSSITNAIELGDRTWNKDKKFGKRRALVEEAQEVKASLKVSKNGKDSLYVGQVALDTIRRNPDLYRQLASRYILIGHSMGGVVAREYVQNSNYYHQDVDKIITLDSPHEGTGALEMQLNLVKHGFNISESVVSTAVAWGLFALNTKYSFMSKMVGLGAAIWATVHGLSNSIAPFVIEKSLQDYTDDDPLVKYVNPSDKPKKGNISYLREIAASENQPMFRLMGGEKSITYSDPYKYVTTPLGYLIPEGIIHAVVNFVSQLDQSDDFTSLEAFTLASKAATMGFAASAAVHEQGTNIVPKASSWAENTKSLEDNVADVKRYRFDAAPIDDEDGWRVVSTITLSTAFACMAVDVSLSWFEGARMAANIALGMGSVAAMTNIAVSLVSENLFTEIEKSHNLPIDSVYANQNTWHADCSNTVSPIAGSSVNDTTINPLIMEDFLYERPFVNLALNDTATLNQLQGMSDSARDVSTLNWNCFYLTPGDSAKDADAKKAANCAVGLFYKADDLTSAIQKPVSALSELKFHSSSDWSKMGMKVDRWERVDGLKPDGSDNPGGVPIRHVERYEVPAITVDNWIEKYSFVVDDLMPHRLRQIRMNFNYQEEIAWECDIKKDSDANDACTVYKRTSGSEWTELRNEKHPVKKNGQFDFEPRKYGYDNLLAIQKDNQNTVTISMVNKSA